MAEKFASTIRVDPELARMAVGLHLASGFRLWSILRHLSREGDGSGKVARSDFKSALHHYRIDYSRQHLNKLLRDGEGLFWNTSRHEIYLRSSIFVAQQLTQRALDQNRDLLRNKPGVTEVLLSPCGSLEQWHATIYAGWLTHRNNPTISREVLSKLFNRDEDTLRRWEQNHLSKKVTVRKNYAQCASTETWNKVRPEPCLTYIAHTKEGYKARFLWQIPNTYRVKGIKTHHHGGQSKKVRKAVNQQLLKPANKWRGGSLIRKLYFDTSKQLRSYLKEYEGVYYLWRGTNRYDHGIFEATETGVGETFSKERVSFRCERRLWGEVRIQL